MSAFNSLGKANAVKTQLLKDYGNVFERAIVRLTDHGFVVEVILKKDISPKFIDGMKIDGVEIKCS